MNAGQQQENKSCTAKNGHDVTSPIITELGQADSNMLPLYELQVTATRALHFTVRNAMRKLCSICGKVDFDSHKKGCQGSGVEKNGYACTRQQQTTICKTHCRLRHKTPSTRKLHCCGVALLEAQEWNRDPKHKQTAHHQTRPSCTSPCS